MLVEKNDGKRRQPIERNHKEDGSFRVLLLGFQWRYHGYRRIIFLHLNCSVLCIRHSLKWNKFLGKEKWKFLKIKIQGRTQAFTST